MKFDTQDLDQEIWDARARAEALQIFSKDSTSRGRSLEEIVDTVKYGHAAELYLIEHCGFTDDKRPYKDVLDPNGKQVEVKVTSGIHNVPYVLEKCNNDAKDKWRNYATILYIWINDKTNTVYNLHGIYHWNGKEFK